MFIIWGTKGRKVSLGVVADWCEACEVPTPFWVTKHYRVSHVYFIPLGGGTHVATSRQCWECGSEFHCEPEDYDQFLSGQLAKQISMEELLLGTNEYLKKQLDARRKKLSGPRSASRNESDIVEVLPVDEANRLDLV